MMGSKMCVSAVISENRLIIRIYYTPLIHKSPGSLPLRSPFQALFGDL
jgi:hypothetical protein